MKRIKKFFALAMMASALALVSAEGADIVVLMDTSGTILPYFEVINNKILVDITKKFIREGDTFHLVSFNSRVNLEIAQPINSEADLSRIVSRFMLLYPLGQNSDFLSGLQYIWQYVSSLDQQRQKIIIVISDGIFNPPPSSPFASYNSGQIQDNIQQISKRIHGAGWNVYYIKLPFPENAEIHTLDGNLLASIAQPVADTSDTSGTTTVTKNGTKQYLDVSTEFTSDLNIETSPLPANDVPLTFVDQVFSMPEIQFPDDLGKKGRFFVLPLKVKNNADTPINMELTGVMINDGVNILSKTSFLNLNPKSSGTLRTEISLPNTILKGPQDIRMTLQFSDSLRVLPQTGTVHVTVTGFSLGMLFRTGSSIFLTLLIIFIAIILVILFFIFIVRRTERPASDAIIEASSAAVITANTVRQTQSQMESQRQLQSQSQDSVKNIMTTSSNAAKRITPTMDSGTLARETVDNSAILSAASVKSEKSSVLSAFSKNKKEEPQTFNSQYNTRMDTSQDIKSISDQLMTDKNERLTVLSTAGKKQVLTPSNLKSASSTYHIPVNGKSNIMLELRVQRQNTNIGKRNVHMMKAGSRMAIGGGQSPFLVFLVKFPPHIAEIRYDGISCDLAILKPEYFPYEKENIIHDCVNRNFTIISEKGFEISFDLQLYEDPVVTLNRLLTSIRY